MNKEINKSTILISQPYLGDPEFDWSTILLCDHNTEGSYGFVLNDQSNLLLKDVVEGFENTNYPLFYGGPVDRDVLFYIHTINDLKDAIKICDGIYVHGNYDELKVRITQGNIKKNEIRFFLGYSGWSGGQLLSEVNRKSWFINNTHASKVLEISPDKIWRTILREMGGKFKEFSNYPIRPELN